MKKLMVALSAVALAICANAAQVDWSATINAPSTLTIGNFKAYMLDAALWDTYVDATGKMSAEYLDKALDSNGFNAESASKWSTGKQNAVTADKTPVSYKMILVDSGNKYAILKEATVTPYDPESESGTLQSGSTTGAKILGTATSGNLTWNTVQSVPEPTSAMLLLLGVAGLALRRRRA